MGLGALCPFPYLGVSNMKRIALGFLLSLTVGCGGTEMTSTSQTCTQKYECTNGSCECTEGPKKNSSCCDPDSTTCTTNKCNTYCKYCS